MPGPSVTPLPDLSGQRAALARSIRRASLAGVLALAVVVVLALGLVWKARQSEEQAARADAEAARATAAQAEAAAQLWSARFNEARAIRIAGGPGARQRAEEILLSLARHPGLGETQRLALRSEAIAQFALLDVDPATNWIRGEVAGAPAAGWFVPGTTGTVVEVRRFANSNLVARFSGPAGAGQSYFSPGGRVVLTTFKTEPPSVVAWRVADASVVFSNAVAPVTIYGASPPAFSMDERLVAFNSRSTLLVRRLEGDSVLRRRAPASAYCFSPDTSRMACASGAEVVIEDTATGEVRTRFNVGFNVAQIAWRPQGDRLGLTGHGGAVSLAELPPEGTERPPSLRRAAGHAGTPIFARFTPDGAALITTSWDGFSNFWEPHSGRLLLAESRLFVVGPDAPVENLMTLRSFPTRGALSRLQSQKGYRVVGAVEARPTPPSGVACSRDGAWLAVDRQHHTLLLETRTGRPIAQLAGVAPLFTPDGALLTCSADTVRRFVPPDVQHSRPGTNAVAGEVFLRTPRGTRANSLALADDGSTLLVCASDKVVLFVDTTNATVRREVEVPAHFAALSADGEHLVTQFHNGAAHLVRLGVTNRVSTLGHHLNTGFDPAGRWLAVATEEALRLYGRGTTNRWQQRHKLALAAGVGAPPPFAFSRDGGLLAVVFNRFDVHLYEAETARLLAVLTPAFPAQIGGTAGLAFSADGRELFAVKQDGEVVAWTLPLLRAALAGIGLDWGEPAVPLMAARRLPAPARLDMWVPAALIAGTSALLAGFVVFALQRRMLAAYERAAQMADARQGELVEAQLRLAQSQKLEALGTLAAGIAHDVNNLLSVIRMSNHFVARAVNADQVTRENLDAIERAAQQGRDLVRSMLGYARRADDAATEFNVQRVAGETMGMLSRQFLSGLTVSLELAPDCPPVRGSSARLEQALLNLVINAAEAMQGRGRLNISARVERKARADALAPAPAGCYVVLAVTDDGPGIAPEILARIFEPFFTTKTGSAQPGTGLGLSVVYTLARQSGWGLHVASTPGRGAEFQIILPVAAPAPDKL